MAEERCTQIHVINGIERRQDRLEEVVDRLTSISADLSKMVAVHEQRISQQEKQINTVELLTERRREEYDEKLGIVFKKIDTMRSESTAQYEALSEKINDMEKQIWRFGGAVAVLAFVFAYGPSILRILDLK